MTDIIDRANDTAQEELARNLAKAPRFDTPSFLTCVGCGEDIPEQRRKLGGVVRCIDCATHLERRR